MANIVHSSISDPYLHEPKGASTADEGAVYVADGSGSGSWVVAPTGWGFYLDNASEQTFNTTASKISIDGEGSSSNEAYLPKSIRGTDSLWDTTNDKITPITAGDSYLARLNLPVTTKTSSPTRITLQLDIGGTSSPTNVVLERDLSLEKTPPYTISVSLPFFTLSTFITNGGQIFLSTDTGSVGITAPSLFISQTHGEM